MCDFPRHTLKQSCTEKNLFLHIRVRNSLTVITFHCCPWAKGACYMQCTIWASNPQQHALASGELPQNGMHFRPKLSRGPMRFFLPWCGYPAPFNLHLQRKTEVLLKLFITLKFLTTSVWVKHDGPYHYREAVSSVTTLCSFSADQGICTAEHTELHHTTQHSWANACISTASSTGRIMKPCGPSLAQTMLLCTQPTNNYSVKKITLYFLNLWLHVLKHNRLKISI